MMAENTAISWADNTQNFWIGCTKVSPACDHCYAERDDEHRRWTPDGWGAGKPRHRTSTTTWNNPFVWDRRAQRTGRRERVFCMSLGDFFDNEVPQEWRVEAWDVIRRTTNLHWMILTKRIGNATKMLPPDWPMPHVGLMSTLENQEVWDRDFPKLMATPAAWHGLSVEPMLGPIDIGDARPDWIICGGESGPNHRPLDLRWVRSLRDQCARNGAAFHFKQVGGLRPTSNGCAIDGREHKEFPEAIAA